MNNKFNIGETVYFTAGNKVKKEVVKHIKEERYIGIGFPERYLYATESVMYLEENDLHSNLESLLDF